MPIFYVLFYGSLAKIYSLFQSDTKNNCNEEYDVLQFFWTNKKRSYWWAGVATNSCTMTQAMALSGFEAAYNRCQKTLRSKSQKGIIESLEVFQGSWDRNLPVSQSNPNWGHAKAKVWREAVLIVTATGIHQSCSSIYDWIAMICTSQHFSNCGNGEWFRVEWIICILHDYVITKYLAYIVND